MKDRQRKRGLTFPFISHNLAVLFRGVQVACHALQEGRI
mgnify:CR=1 FL=1